LSDLTEAGALRAAVALRRAVAGAILVLIALTAWWCLAGHVSAGTIVLACVATSPLWLGLPPLISGKRRTFAWMSLALTPYLVLAITESVANPARRTWAGACLLVTLLLFVLIVAYLRVTRGERATPVTETDAGG
jgi:uncharacterized membrane protein